MNVTQRKYRMVTRKRGNMVSLSVKLAASVVSSPTLRECFWKKVCFWACVSLPDLAMAGKAAGHLSSIKHLSIHGRAELWQQLELSWSSAGISHH